jgi:hypothetical protein
LIRFEGGRGVRLGQLTQVAELEAKEDIALPIAAWSHLEISGKCSCIFWSGSGLHRPYQVVHARHNAMQHRLFLVIVHDGKAEPDIPYSETGDCRHGYACLALVHVFSGQ